jgi:hypothetical protein
MPPVSVEMPSEVPTVTGIRTRWVLSVFAGAASFGE